MNQENQKNNQLWWDANYISDEGERVSHLNPDSVFNAHLSIYRFASEYYKNKFVLDAGLVQVMVLLTF